MHDQDSGRSKNYGGNFMIQYWNIMRLMSGSLFMKLFLLWISLWNVYKVHDQDSGHSKNYGEILWFSTEISWDSCPVHYLWSCSYCEFHYEMSIKCMIRILAIVHDQDSGHRVHDLAMKSMIRTLAIDSCPIHYLWSFFTINFTMKCLLSAWPGFWP